MNFILGSAAAGVIGLLATTMFLLVVTPLRHAIFRKVISHKFEYDDEFTSAEWSAFLGAGTISLEILSFDDGRLAVEKANVDGRKVNLKYLNVGAKFYKLRPSKIEIRVSSIARVVPKSKAPTKYDVWFQFRVPRW